MTSFLIILVVTLSFPVLSSSSTTASCKSKTFSAKSFTSFENCNVLPTLDAVQHWTYTPSLSSLSMAFTASPPTSNGWVAWALNPTSTGMSGSQSLVAFKPATSGPISVSTYDIKSYSSIIKGPISYNVTNLSAEESDGQITIFATWKLLHGSETVNQVWQVGPVVNGRPGKHAFGQNNLESKMELTLIASGPIEAPTGSLEPKGKMVGDSAPAPVKGGAVKMMSTFGVSFVVLGLSVFVVSMF